MNIDLSIIIPCHNAESYIKQNLDSILFQKTEYKFEVIFICDKCEDYTHEYINGYLKDTYINYKIFDSNYGCPGLPRNVGIKNSIGEYIVFIDDDDCIISDSYITKILDFIKKSNSPIIRFGYENNSLDKWYWSMVWQYCYKRDFIKDYLFDNTIGTEDVNFNNFVFGRLGFKKLNWNGMRCENFVPYLDEELYYYNFPRVGSVLYNMNANINNK